MTRYEIHVDRFVTHDLPADRAHTLAAAVEARLAALPRGVDPRSGPTAGADDLADRVAAEVWREVGRARQVPR